MDWERQCIRLCAGMIGLATVLRLAGTGAFAPAVQALTSREAVSFFVYLQTGRLVRTQPERASLPSYQLPQATQPEPQTPEFSPADLELVGLTDYAGLHPELEELLTQPLALNLRGENPAVLILHSHATECYTQSPGEDYAESGAYRTLDTDYNMVCLGDLVAQRLTQAGIGVIHDRTLHDAPDYNSSYSHAAQGIESVLAEYPGIQLILDLHRDAADTAYGQMVTECAVGGQTSAQLMFVVGTDAAGLTHPRWRENLALALKLQVVLERENPGICRNLNLSRNRYNQHYGQYALIVEIGAAGNTLAQATLAAEKLAQGILTLAGE